MEEENKVSELLFNHHFGKFLTQSLFVVVPPNTAIIALVLIGINTVLNLIVLVSLYIGWCITCCRKCKNTPATVNGNHNRHGENDAGVWVFEPRREESPTAANSDTRANFLDEGNYTEATAAAPAGRQTEGKEYAGSGSCERPNCNCSAQFPRRGDYPPPDEAAVPPGLPSSNFEQGRGEIYDSTGWNTLWSSTASGRYENATLRNSHRTPYSPVRGRPREASCPDASSGGEDQ